jgi:hypothetical protein
MLTPNVGCGHMTGGHSKLTMQIDCARNHAHESAPISSKSSRTSPGRWPVVARNLPFEDRRHARTSRIDFLTVRDRHRYRSFSASVARQPSACRPFPLRPHPDCVCGQRKHGFQIRPGSVRVIDAHQASPNGFNAIFSIFRTMAGMVQVQQQAGLVGAP